MEILLLLIPVSVLLVLAIGALFWWSIKSGQFDDLDGPAHRILADDDTNDVIPMASTECDNSGGPQGDLTSVKPAPDEAR
jgi:cbb3-type cytochrome oxidase maturation protein